MPEREVKWKPASELEMTRRTIQHEFLRQLTEAGFSFRQGDRELFGLQSKVRQAVNQQGFGPTRFNTNAQQVSDWCRRVRENNYQVTNCQQDYTSSSQNRRKFWEAEQKRIRDFIREGQLKCTEIASVYSDKMQTQVTVSKSTARRYMKSQLGEEPSHVAAKPKGYRVGGMTAHHNKCRLVEAKRWKAMRQDVIDGMVFADESKMRFREHRNK